MNDEAEEVVKMLNEMAGIYDEVWKHKRADHLGAMARKKVNPGLGRFSINVVENGYIITMNGDQFIYNSLDTIA
jgi:hypothetical protein